MYNMKVCPMMHLNNMQMADMMFDDIYDMPANNMPLGNNMPYAHDMPIYDMYEDSYMTCKGEIMEDKKSDLYILEENEKDENHYMEMMPLHCKKILEHVDAVLDKMEDKDESIYNTHHDKSKVRAMMEEICRDIQKEMPELMQENEPKRQYGAGGFVRDIAGILLINELMRRRRRRRYFDYGYGGQYYGMPYGGYPYYGRMDYSEDFYMADNDTSIDYDDFYVNDND